MNDGWLDEHVHVQMPSGQRLLDVDGLKETLQSVCRNKTTQPPFLSGINPRGAAANESTRHLGYDDLLAASRPRAMRVVDAG